MISVSELVYLHSKSIIDLMLLFPNLLLRFFITKAGNEGGVIPTLLHDVRDNSQWWNAIYCLTEIMSECESKLKGSCIRQDGSVKWTESDHNIYFAKSGFRFGSKSIRAPYTGILTSFK